MNYRDFPVHKALYFDLKIKDLEKYYSAVNPKSGYSRVKEFMKKHGFDHEQYSGYHSRKPITDADIFDIARALRTELPWITQCANKFEATDVGENSDIMSMFNTYSKDTYVYE